MGRRAFSQMFELEAVMLVRDCGRAQVAGGPAVHVSALRMWGKDKGVTRHMTSRPWKPEELEIERLRREVSKLKAERDI